MIKREKGFTLIELLIVMVIFTIAIAAIARLFITTVGQFKQQSKITETYIEGVIGLEQLRLDIGHAGYGLPWNLDLDGNGTNDAPYLEAVNNGSTTQDETIYHDSTAGVPPRAFVSGDGEGVGVKTCFVGRVSVQAKDPEALSGPIEGLAPVLHELALVKVRARLQEGETDDEIVFA